MSTRTILSTCLALGVLLGQITAWAGDREKAMERAGEWERAAENRELAALSQESNAQSLLAAALQLRAKKPRNEQERRSFFAAAGEAERKAGDLHLAASVNYEKAEENWSRAAKEYAKSSGSDKQQNAETMAQTAHENARQACGRAAEAYELAAEACSPDRGDQLSRAGVYSEQAAACREKLAGMR